MSKLPVLETKLLTNAQLGLYTITTYYNDGTHETHISPSGKSIVPNPMALGVDLYERYSEPPRASGMAVIGWVIIIIIVLWEGYYRLS